MNVLNHDVYWCDGCRHEFPLKRLKSCGACRIATYCSPTCQAVAWKGGHKKSCREIVVQKDQLKGWAQIWNAFLRWIAVRVFEFTNRPGNHRDRCFEIQLRKTGSNDLSRAYEVLGGRIETLNVSEEVRFEPNSRADGESLKNQIFAALLVRGEEGEFIDATGLAWGLPSSIHDTPERSEVWGKHCVEVMKSIVAGSKPRRAIRDATLMMETALLMRGEVTLHQQNGRSTVRRCDRCGDRTAPIPTDIPP